MLDVTRDLTQFPQQPDAVCTLIARFAEEWTGRTPAPTAESERELTAAERRLGQALPPALRWLYRNYGTDNTLIGTQDRLLTPAELTADAGGVITVCEENQKCAQWGIHFGEGHDDPPVLWRNLQGPSSQADQWQHYHPRLSIYLLESVINEAILAENALTLHRELDPPAGIDLSAATPLGLPSHTFWAEPEAGPVTWYALEDVLLRNDGNTWLWALARTKEAAQQLEQRLPGPWERLQG